MDKLQYLRLNIDSSWIYLNFRIWNFKNAFLRFSAFFAMIHYLIAWIKAIYQSE